MNLSATRALLERRGLHLRRDLGQNFLIDEERARKLAELAGVEPGDCVLEVGTGLGALTRALAARASRVVTLEVDSGLAAALREESLLPANVELHHVDALERDLSSWVVGVPREHARVVANLPYSVATPLLRKLLDHRDAFCSWSVMVQREVGARLAAGPGDRDYGSFAVLHTLSTRVEVVATLPPALFFPAPRVVSSFVRITPRADAAFDPIGPIDRKELRRIERVVRAAFGQRRKTLVNALRGGGFGKRAESAVRAIGVDPRARAETLEPEQFRELAAALRDG